MNSTSKCKITKCFYKITRVWSKLKNSEKRQIVGAAGIPARSTASSRNLLGILLQCRRQELKVSGAKREANARGSYS